MGNKEKKDLLIGSVAIPVTFESLDDDKNYNKVILGEAGQAMTSKIKINVTDVINE